MTTAMRDENPSYKWIRVFSWIAAVALGAADTWATRFTMNPDGISYLDMGDAYLRGDWYMAINAFWSPLYSWILGLVLKVVKPSAYWEYPLAHLLNFVVFLAALICFEFFLRAFIAYRKKSEHDSGEDKNEAQPGTPGMTNKNNRVITILFNN